MLSWHKPRWKAWSGEARSSSDLFQCSLSAYRTIRTDCAESPDLMGSSQNYPQPVRKIITISIITRGWDECDSAKRSTRRTTLVSSSERKDLHFNHRHFHAHHHLFQECDSSRFLVPLSTASLPTPQSFLSAILQFLVIFLTPSNQSSWLWYPSFLAIHAASLLLD